MTTPADHDRELDQHLRRTLAAVAATVAESPAAESAPARRRSRRRRRFLIGAGVTIAAIPLAAGAWVRFGPEYVDRIPPANPILSGTLDGERYWVVDGREIPRCAGSRSGIEILSEQHNIVGQEWNSFGYVFGEYDGDCPVATPTVPPEHTYDADGGQQVGDGMLWAGALHDDIDQVRATLGDGEPFDVKPFAHEGDNYYVLEVPPGTARFTVEYLIDGEVLEPLRGESAAHGMATD